MTEDPTSIALVEDIRFQDHRAPAGHPERSERLVAVSRALEPYLEHLTRVEPRPAGDEEILRVHSPEHLEAITSSAGQPGTHFDADTFGSEDSFAVASLAAGSTVDLALRVARREVRAGLSAIRPPGHHAENDHPMGFCLFNNVAIAARALQAELGLEKLMILDWDVHHGNGTQHSFEHDPTVLYVSTHQYPFYPGTGAFAEAGIGAGLGTTVNLPMPAGCGDAEYVGLLQRAVVPIARRFAPEMILVSCGFDAHRDDPLGGMQVSAAGYLAMAGLVRALARELCQERLMYVLEGGYALSGLEEGTRAIMEGLLAPEPAYPGTPIPAPPGSTLQALLEAAAQVHGQRHPDFGAP